MNRSWEIHPLGAFMVNRVPWLAARWQPCPAIENGFENVDSLDAPELAVAVVPGVRANDGPTHLPRVMVGIPPAWKSASGDHPR